MNKRAPRLAEAKKGPQRLNMHDLRRPTESGSALLRCGPSWRSQIYGG